MMDRRPSPDQILAQINQDSPKGGKLKIYLGAAPGVGKTHTMLQDALARREQGLDVVAGVVESHGRTEIDSMLQRFEILPARIVDYHGKPLLEFDLDEALRRRPSLILIDEMAHTNIPGLRHAKRWQDIKELIDRGIDVFTTLNVQHIESLNDIIAQIIGIRVRETVPDSMLGLADTIELVDLAPDDLLRRLQEGKVYIPAQAELASQHFFRKGNLIALRELALRFTAERVDDQILLHRQGEGIAQTWPTVERLLVCVGNDESSSKVIRAARRMATGLHATWMAVHVDVPRVRLTEKQRNAAIQNLRLAEQLGAETRILTGLDIVKEIMIFARQRNVTKIVIGKRLHSRWREIFANSLAFDLLRHSGEIDVYIIRSEAQSERPVKQTPVKRKSALISYFYALMITGIATAINLMIYPYLGPEGLSNIVMIYLVGVVLVALQGKQMGSSILASVLSALIFTYFFVTPRIGFSFLDIQYILSFVIMVVVAQVISHLTILNRQQADIAYLGEQRTVALHALTRQLASTRGTSKLLEIAMRYISDVFDSEVIALLNDGGILKPRASSSAKKELNAKDMGVTQWVFDMGQIAGLGTDTLPNSDSLYLPLHGSQGTVGVLKIRPHQSELLLIPEQLHLLEACANQIALALEVDRLQDNARETAITMATERLRSALFESLSRELQNPLATIVRLINKLTKKSQPLDEDESQAAVKNLYRETDRLNRLINNLLQITRLEEGQVQLQRNGCSLEDIIQTALTRLEKKLNLKPCQVQLSPNLPLISCDKVLIEQVFVNLIENAIEYSPPDTPIEIAASVVGTDVLVSVGDRGPGIVTTDIQKVFETFYRGEKSRQDSGSGLGLSVSQSILKSHGGKIWAENRVDGGAIFYFTLPLRGPGDSANAEQAQAVSP
jgi:two-component system sensor histidine kinase KdpD